MKGDTPNRIDISPTNGMDLDENYALKHFYGKNIVQAEALFRENASYYSCDLLFMGNRAFCYYLPAFCSYLTSKASCSDDAALYSFITLLESKIKTSADMLNNIQPSILDCVDYCITNIQKFDLDEKLIKRFKRRLLSIKNYLFLNKRKK